MHWWELLNWLLCRVAEGTVIRKVWYIMSDEATCIAMCGECNGGLDQNYVTINAYTI